MVLQAAEIDFSRLTDVERETLEQVIPLVQDGEDVREIADRFGVDANEIQTRIDDLGARLMALSGKITLPPLTDEEYEALKDSLAAHGQQMPILRGAPSSGLPGQVIDGRARRRACAQLKLEPVYKDVEGTAEQLRALGLVLNLARRQLSASSRRGIVKAELLRNQERSDRVIASAVGVSPTTVGTVRRELERAGELSKLDSRTSKDGAQRPAASTPRTSDRTPERSVRVIVDGDQFEQLVGPWVECKAFRLVERRPGVHELQVRLLSPNPAPAPLVARVRALAREVQEQLGHKSFVDEFLANAVEVFGREITGLDDLYVDEAEWAIAQLEVLAGHA